MPAPRRFTELKADASSRLAGHRSRAQHAAAHCATGTCNKRWTHCPAGQPHLEAIAQARAQALLQDHRRIREAADAKGSYQVTASLPVDVMGIFVLVPAGVSGSQGA